MNVSREWVWCRYIGSGGWPRCRWRLGDWGINRAGCYQVAGCYQGRRDGEHVRQIANNRRNHNLLCAWCAHTTSSSVAILNTLHIVFHVKQTTTGCGVEIRSAFVTTVPYPSQPPIISKIANLRKLAISSPSYTFAICSLVEYGSGLRWSSGSIRSSWAGQRSP